MRRKAAGAGVEGSLVGLIHQLRGSHNAERQPQSVPELIFGATGATGVTGVTGAIGGCVKFLPAVLFFSRNNTIYSVLEDNGQDY